MRAGSRRQISAPVREASKFSARSHTSARRRPLGLEVPVRERAENFKRLLMRGGNLAVGWRFGMRSTVQGPFPQSYFGSICGSRITKAGPRVPATRRGGFRQAGEGRLKMNSAQTKSTEP